MPLDIKRLEPSAATDWDNFVAECGTATFFHRAGWQRVIERAFGHETHYLYATEGGTIRAVLPLVRVRSWLFGDSLVSIPFGVYGGVAATDDDAAAALLREAEKLGRELAVDYVELRCLDRPQADWPTKGLYVTFRRPIEPTEDAALKAIPRKQRAMVRKGIDNGLVSVVDDSTERFFPMYAESVRNLGTPVFGKRYFEILREEFGNDCRVLTIMAGEKPVASVMSFYFRDQVLPYYGGGTAEARNLAANDFMYWELMRRSCAEGIKLFDFGRSKVDSGSYRFKKHWGFEPEPLHYQCLLVRAKEMPNLSPNNPKYKLMIDMWRRLPLPVANLIGPPIARNLG